MAETSQKQIDAFDRVVKLAIKTGVDFVMDEIRRKRLPPTPMAMQGSFMAYVLQFQEQFLHESGHVLQEMIDGWEKNNATD